MNFKPINRTLIANSEEAAQYLEAVGQMGEVELFGIEDLRTVEQNAKMWPMLGDISKQVTWMGQKHDTKVWKVIITAAHNDQTFVHGIGGTLVVIPCSTRRLSKKAFSELIEQIYAFGAEQEVKWSEPALAAYEQYREAR